MVGMVTPQHVRDKNLDHPSFDGVWAEAEASASRCASRRREAVDRCRSASTLARGSRGTPSRTRSARWSPSWHSPWASCTFPEPARSPSSSGRRLAAVLARASRRARELTPERQRRRSTGGERVFPLRRCFIGCDPDEHGIRGWCSARRRRRVYASDYHHWDCKSPTTVKIIAERNDHVGGPQAATSSKRTATPIRHLGA